LSSSWRCTSMACISNHLLPKDRKQKKSRYLSCASWSWATHTISTTHFILWSSHQFFYFYPFLLLANFYCIERWIESPRLVALAVLGFSIFACWVQVSARMSIIPVMFYLSAGLAGCWVDPGISRGVCKLARTSRL
jgi:hypothetical protein